MTLNTLSGARAASWTRRLLVAAVVFASSTATAGDYRPMGTAGGIDFAGKIASLPDGDGGRYDEALGRLVNRNSLDAHVTFRVELTCSDGTVEDKGSVGVTLIPNLPQSGEGAGLWWRGCGGDISAVLFTDVNVRLIDISGYH